MKLLPYTLNLNCAKYKQDIASALLYRPLEPQHPPPDTPSALRVRFLRLLVRASATPTPRRVGSEGTGWEVRRRPPLGGGGRLRPPPAGGGGRLRCRRLPEAAAACLERRPTAEAAAACPPGCRRLLHGVCKFETVLGPFPRVSFRGLHPGRKTRRANANPFDTPCTTI